ncbi:MAG: hypothetical protein SVP52_07555 [Chloroflexota bacterium]|nr:hypothetical protein [Chloroflexota bacterium]
MSQNINFKAIAEKLVNGKPLAFKNYPDGSLVVIAPTGQKFKFTPEQVQEAQEQLKPKPKPKSKPKSTTKKKTASKPTAKRPEGSAKRPEGTAKRPEGTKSTKAKKT